MSEGISNAEFRAAIESLNINASNFQVFTFWIAAGMLLGIVTIGLTIGVIQTQDETFPESSLTIAAIIDLIALAAIVLAYLAYLRNVGKYIYGRVRPVNFGERPDYCGAETA